MSAPFEPDTEAGPDTEAEPDNEAEPDPGARTPLPVSQTAARDLRALRILVVVLVPLAVWTIAGLIVLWPSTSTASGQPELSPYSAPGLTVTRGEITAVTPTPCDGQSASTPSPAAQSCADAAVRLRTGPEKGQVVEVALNSPSFGAGAEAGQGVRLLRLPAQDGQPVTYQFSDFERQAPLLAFALVFVAAVVAVGRWRGVATLLSLAGAGVVVVTFTFPALLAGSQPVAVGLVSAAAIGFVTMYATQGFSARSSTALVATLLGLVIVAGLGWWAVTWAHLSGVSTGDAALLSATAPNLELGSVAVGAVVLASLGVLIPVTSASASAVWELADSAELPTRRAFFVALGAGRGGVAAAVFPLVFAVTGAMLGALLLATSYGRPLLEVVQSETVASVLLSILVGATGVVLALPLTAAIGLVALRAGDRRPDRPAVEAADSAPEADVTEEPASELAPASRTGWRSLHRHLDDFGDFADLHEPDSPARPRQEEESTRHRRAWR